MIEVEIKVSLEGEAEKKLIEGAQLLSEKTIDDAYYDTADYGLTTRDFWLRKRNGRFELKKPVNNEWEFDKRKANQYEELEDDEAIKTALDLPKESSLETELQACGYTVFCRVVSTRRKYRNQEFAVDLDKADFGFELGEVELMVEDALKAEEAEKKILAFLEEKGISTEVRKTGKIIEYIKRFNPNQYEILQKAGMIRS